MQNIGVEWLKCFWGINRWVVLTLLAFSAASFMEWHAPGPAEAFQKKIAFQRHFFDVSTNASGSIRELVIKVLRDNQPLMTIRLNTDGWVIDAQAADLDQNGSPEIYVYSCSYGSGAFGRVYGYQFFPTSFDVIRMEALNDAQKNGYMGHDYFKIENQNLIRQFPVYRPGDTNAQPTGGFRTIRYTLRDIDKKLTLVGIETTDSKTSK